MSTDADRRRAIERLAYSKWEAAGRPQGDSQRFWQEAEREYIANMRRRRGDLMRNLPGKLIVTALAVALLIVHILTTVKLDGVALALLAIGLLPWVGTFVEELGVPGFVQLKLRKVESEVNALRFIVASMMSRWELEILEKLIAPEPYVLDTNNLADTFRRDLADLWGRGFIRQKQPGVYFPGGQGNQDLKNFYELDALGHEYLDLRKRFLWPVSAKPDLA